MKTNDVLLLGGLAAALFFLMKPAKAQEDATAAMNASTYPQAFTTTEDVKDATTGKTTTKVQTVSFGSAKEGVAALNAAFAAGKKVAVAGDIEVAKPSTSNNKTGTYYLASTGKTIQVRVQQAARDSSGQTAMDKIIAKNKLAKAKKLSSL